MVARTCTLVVLSGLLAGCSSMLPSTKEVTASGSGWQHYRDAENTFDQIIPGKTTTAQLRQLSLDPASNPSVTVLQHWQVKQRFIPNTLVTLEDLDAGVRDCVEAKGQCSAYEINHVSTQTKRKGNAALDLLRMYRETHTAGWRFNGLILMKDGVVLYKLTAGQPHIRQVEEKQDMLGPVQALASRLNLDGLKDQVAGIKSSVSGKTDAPAGDPAPAVGISALKRP